MDLPRRQPPPRLAFDYRLPGAYFVPICTLKRAHVLSVIQNEGWVTLTPVGEVAERHWRMLSDRYSDLRLDTHVVLPDHFHGILWLAKRQVSSVSHVIGLFKAGCAREARGFLGRDGLRQRCFYDRVVRDGRELAALQRYIAENPRRWALGRNDSSGGISVRAG